MICDVCKGRNATVHVQKINAGQLMDIYLCTECALRLGYAKRVNRFAADGAGRAAPDAGRRCPCCGCSLADIMTMGVAGCSECYTTFRDRMQEIVRQTHGEAKYCGHVPRNSGQKKREAQLDEARVQLQAAIERQDFEHAAVLRDLIRSLEAQAQL